MTGVRRRGFLGLLSSLPLVGPGLAQDITGQNALGLASAAINRGQSDGDDGDDGYEDDSSTDSSIKAYGSKSYYRNCIKEIIETQRELQNTPLSHYIKRVERLDSDLLTNRSMALQTKIREQAKRDRIDVIKRRRVYFLQELGLMRKSLKQASD